MTDALLTNHQRKVWAAFIENDGNVSAAARSIGLRRSNFQTALRRAEARLEQGAEIVRVSDGPAGRTTVSVPARSPHTAREGFAVERETVQTDGSGGVVQKWEKFKQAALTPEEAAVQIKAGLADAPRFTPVAPALAGAKKLRNLIPVADGHWGMLAWGAETGAPYDLSIADRLHREVLADVLARLPRAETGILLGLGDQLHANGIRPMTPASGNLLDVDTRYPKALRTVTRWFRDATVAMLDQHERVIVKVMKGNHDEDAAEAIALGLDMFFHDESRVSVDSNPDYWWYHRFGENLIAAHHGHQIKPADMPTHVADRRRHDWAAAHKHILHGHFHRPGVVPVGATPVECIPTVVAADAYSAPRYTNRRGMVGITYHEDRGEHSRQEVWLNDGELLAA